MIDIGQVHERICESIELELSVNILSRKEASRLGDVGSRARLDVKAVDGGTEVHEKRNVAATADSIRHSEVAA